MGLQYVAGPATPGKKRIAQTTSTRTTFTKNRRRPTTPRKKRNGGRDRPCYATHYRGILTVISSFSVDYYGTNKGNYANPAGGDHGDPTTGYPIPSGDLLEYGKSHPEALRGIKLPDDSTPYDDIPFLVWKEYQKQQEHDHRRCTRAAIEDQQLTAERARAEHTAWQNKFKEKDALKLMFGDGR